MPAMPKEKATLLPIDKFSDIKIKEQLVASGNNRGLSTNTTPCTMAKDTNKDNKAIVVVPTESVLSPKKQPNSYEKYINDCKPASSENSSLPQQSTMENNNTIKSAKLSLVSADPTSTVAVNKTPSKRSANDFIFGKYIGEGSFSTVYLAREINTHREYAIKVCDKMHILREKKQDYVQRERQVMHMLANVPGFVNLYCTFQDARSLYFVMTNAKNGDLLPYITKVGSFDLECTRHYAAELVLALEVMHSRGIVHRDLKPENILLDEDMHTLIADFGSAKILNTHQPNQQQSSSSPHISSVTSSVSTSQSSNDRISNDTNSSVSNSSSQNLQNNYRKRKGSFVGTAQYVSPEVLQSHPVSRSADLWALGCIIYQMISGLPPFRGKTDYFIFREILSCNLMFPEGFDEDAKDLVKKLLKLNADERIGAQDKSGHYESLRSHPFFNNINWYTVRSQNPPAIYPYLPGNKEEKELRSQYRVPDNLEPGLGDRQRNRLLAYDLGTSLGEIELNEEEEEEEEVEEIKTVQPYKYDFAEKEKKIKLEKQAIDDSEWHMFAENEVILKKGYINKRKGLFARRRMLLLTTGPKLIYIDPVAKVKKGEIPWSADLRVEPKNFKIFFIHTPKRTYYLEDPEGFALSWTNMIDTVRCKTYGVELSNGENSS